MTVPAPYSLPVVSGWQLVDWLDKSWASPPAAGGVAKLELPQLPADTRWNITHAVIGCTSATSTVLRWYYDSVANPQLRDGTDAGNFCVADWSPGLRVPPGRTLIAVWTGASDGAIGTLNLQADVLRMAGA